MKGNYDMSFEKIVGHEGGFTDDRNDRGNWTSGEIGRGQLKGTKYGISAMSYPSLDIRNLGLEDAKAIYKRDYWDRVKADELPSGVDHLVFDMSVNHGSKTAVQLLQGAAKANVDGVIGPKTLAAVQVANTEALLTELTARRGVHYAGIGSFNRYGLGWMRRLAKVFVEALAMVTSKPLPPKPETDAPVMPDPADPGFWNGLWRRV